MLYYPDGFDDTLLNPMDGHNMYVHNFNIHDGLVQDCNNFSALAMELQQSCAMSVIYSVAIRMFFFFLFYKETLIIFSMHIFHINLAHFTFRMLWLHTIFTQLAKMY